MKWIVFVLPMLALAGCVSPTGNGVLRSTADLPRNARIVAPAERSKMQAATEAALVRLGYRVGAVGEFVLFAAYSERPLQVSFETDGGLHSGAAKLPNLAICSQKVQRLTLVITEIRTGRPAYQGQAEITHCADTDHDNAMRLANAAVAKLQPPLVTH